MVTIVQPTLIPTPTINVGSAITEGEAFSSLCDELNTFGKWTETCKSIVQSKPMILFKLDKARYLLHDIGNLIMNPLMMLCPHCCKMINLKRILGFEKMITHLQLHENQICYDISNALQQYMTGDKFCIPMVSYPDVFPAKYLMDSFYVRRNLGDSCYTSHWMSQLCKQLIVKKQSLIFQENDALLTQILSYPCKYHELNPRLLLWQENYMSIYFLLAPKLENQCLCVGSMASRAAEL